MKIQPLVVLQAPAPLSRLITSPASTTSRRPAMG
jgi:hypothetical protein